MCGVTHARCCAYARLLLTSAFAGALEVFRAIEEPVFLLTDPKHLLTVHGAVLTGTKKEHCTKSGIPVNAGFFRSDQRHYIREHVLLPAYNTQPHCQRCLFLECKPHSSMLGKTVNLPYSPSTQTRDTDTLKIPQNFVAKLNIRRRRALVPETSSACTAPPAARSSPGAELHSRS